jgi:hypothetical protein
MALTFNGVTKTITLTAGTTSLSVRDLWSRWVDWLLTSDNSKFAIAMSQVGGNDIDTVAGTKIPIYVFLQNGWKLKPQEANHTLNVGDGILLVDGGGDPFINTTGSYVVRVNYQQPVQAISFDSGGGGGTGMTTEQAQWLEELWRIRGLDSANPWTVTPTGESAGSIYIAFTGDGINTSTATRQ